MSQQTCPHHHCPPQWLSVRPRNSDLWAAVQPASVVEFSEWSAQASCLPPSGFQKPQMWVRGALPLFSGRLISRGVTGRGWRVAAECGQMRERRSTWLCSVEIYPLPGNFQAMLCVYWCYRCHWLKSPLHFFFSFSTSVSQFLLIILLKSKTIFLAELFFYYYLSPVDMWVSCGRTGLIPQSCNSFSGCSQPVPWVVTLTTTLCSCHLSNLVSPTFTIMNYSRRWEHGWWNWNSFLWSPHDLHPEKHFMPIQRSHVDIYGSILRASTASIMSSVKLHNAWLDISEFDFRELWW